MPHDLPGELTSFVGRRRELEGIAGTLPRARILTPTGAGGCGKTRLALRAARGALGSHPDVQSSHRIHRFLAERPTVLLPAHDAQAPARLAAMEPAPATAIRLAAA